MGNAPFNGTQQQWEEMVAKNNSIHNSGSCLANDNSLNEVINHILQSQSHVTFPDIIKEIKLALLGHSQKVKEQKILELKRLNDMADGLRREIEEMEQRMKLIDNV